MMIPRDTLNRVTIVSEKLSRVQKQLEEISKHLDALINIINNAPEDRDVLLGSVIETIISSVEINPFTLYGVVLSSLMKVLVNNIMSATALYHYDMAIIRMLGGANNENADNND